MKPSNAFAQDHKSKERKITCTTCQLKGCVGRCHFEAVKRPRLRGTSLV